MKRFFILSIVFSFLTLSFSFHWETPAFAETSCDPSSCPSNNDNPEGRLSCLNEVTKKCEEQLRDTQKQEKTLKSQLNIIDGQMQVTKLKIEETDAKIEKLRREISDLSSRINRIGSTLDTLSELLLKRIIQTYKYSNTTSTIDLLFSSHGFAELLERLKYIQVAQAYDKKKLYELQATKLAYNDQKQDKQTRQSEAEKLNKELEVYKIQLAQQKRDKDELLKITKNDEAKYASLLAQARAEYVAIQGIIAGKGTETEVGQVSQGQKIATVIDGQSCNSGGAHLHFTVVKDGSTLNPFNYLKPTDSQNCSGSECGSSDADPFNPSGNWEWPLNSPIKMNQGYGNTWAVQHTWVGRIYNFHNGIDIEGSSLEVKAVKQGKLFRGSYSGSGGCTLPYVRVKHSEEGLETLYLHVYY